MATKKTFELKQVITRKEYRVEIVGAGGLIMNRMPDLSQPKTKTKNQAKEDPTEREYRIWKTKAYTLEDGRLIIPAENIHQSIKDGAKYWGGKIPGEGQKRYTDVITSAAVCSHVDLACHIDDPRVIPYGCNVNGNPSAGKGGSMVYKIRPLIQPWGGTFSIFVFDDRLDIDVLATVIQFAGTFKGVCDHRPTYGRYELKEIEEMKPTKESA
jgi:hypothetical protein